MSLFPFLQLQELEPEDADSPLDYFEVDRIVLEDSIDGDALDKSWSGMVAEAQSDPEWQSFYQSED